MSTIYLKNITGYIVTLYLGNPTGNTPIIRSIKPDETINSIDDTWEDFVVQPLLNAGILTKLTLGEPPIITLDLLALITLPAMGTTTLTINAIGTPVLTYQWYSSFDNIAFAAVSGATTNTLGPVGTDYYFCIVTNAYGTATSSVCNIQTSVGV